MTTLLSYSDSILNSAVVTGSLVLITVLVLLALLVQKEITSLAHSERLLRLGQMLNVAIAPLLITFILIAIFKLIEVLK